MQGSKKKKERRTEHCDFP